MIAYPEIDPVAFTLGPLKVHWYGLMYLIGFSAAWWLGRVRARQSVRGWRGVDVDDVLFSMKNSWSTVNGPFPAPFDQPFYILLNVAVGGNWPGAPDGNTRFPVSMEVDYVRVFSGEP